MRKDLILKTFTTTPRVGTILASLALAAGVGGAGCLAVVTPPSSQDAAATTGPSQPAGCQRYASSWTDVNSDPGGTFGDFQFILTSAAGEIFSGPAYFASGHDWKLAALPLSSDNTSTTASSWQTVDTVAPTGSNAGGYTLDGTRDPDGRLIVVGGSVDSSGNYLNWWTRISTDEGTTWTQSDTYSGADAGQTTASAGAVTSDAQGNLYVGGAAGPFSNETGIVRRSSDHGASWSTVLNYQYPGGGRFTWFEQVIQLPSGALLAFGSGADASSHYHGLVYKSVDGGQSFSALTDYHPAGVNNVYFEWATLDSRGNVLLTAVADTTTDADGYWQVLRTSDGVSFTPVDSYVLATGQGAYDVYPVKIFRNSAGDFYVPGYATDSGGNSHGIVRVSRDGGDSWSTLFDYVDSSVGYGGFYGFGEDANHNLFASGYGANGVVMRLDCVQ